MNGVVGFQTIVYAIRATRRAGNPVDTHTNRAQDARYPHRRPGDLTWPHPSACINHEGHRRLQRPISSLSYGAIAEECQHRQGGDWLWPLPTSMTPSVYSKNQSPGSIATAATGSVRPPRRRQDTGRIPGDRLTVWRTSPTKSRLLQGEEIPGPADSPQESRMLWVGLELFPQLPHVHVNRPRGREGSIAPDDLQHLVTKHDTSLVADQMIQHLELAPRQLDHLARSDDTSLVEIDTYVSELEEW